MAHARFSPNGKWIAYASDESGKVEIYVQVNQTLLLKIYAVQKIRESRIRSQGGKMDLQIGKR